jgi:hypothetical protein
MLPNPLLLFSLCLLSYSVPFAQGLLFEQGILDGHHHRFAKVAVHDGKVYTADQREYGTFGTTTFLTARDSVGNMLWEVSLAQTGSYVDVMDLKTDANGNLFLVASSRLDCFFGGCASYLIKFDNQGNELWASYWNNINCSPSNLIDLRFHEDQTMSLILNSQGSLAAIVSLDQSGIELSNQPFNADSLQFHGRLSNGDFIGVNGNEVFKFSTVGVTLGTFTSSNPIVDLTIQNDSIYLLGPNTITLLNNQLSLLQEGAFPGYTNFTKWNTKSNLLRIIHETPSTFTVLHFDPNLNLLGTTNIPNTHASTYALDLDPHILSVFEENNLYVNKQVRLRHYSMNNPNGQNTAYGDVGVSNVQITNTQISQTPQPNVYYVQVSANATITNYGNIPLQSCQLLHVYNGLPYDCGQNSYTQTLNNLNLAPGASMTVPMALFHAQNELLNGDTLKTEICVFTANPNGQIDASISNDHYCTEALFGYATSEVLEEFNFSLFPNPGEDWVSVHFSGQNGKVEFFDLSGRKIHFAPLQKGINFLDISDIPSGHCIVYVASENSSKYHSFVKL